MRLFLVRERPHWTDYLPDSCAVALYQSRVTGCAQLYRAIHFRLQLLLRALRLIRLDCTMPAQESSSRPSFSARSASSSFGAKDRRQNGNVPQSPGATPPSTSHKASFHRSHIRAPMVGHKSAHQARVPSAKNLNKLTKLTQAREADNAHSVRHHRRSHSHTPSNSPVSKQFHGPVTDASLARNRSDAGLPRASSNIPLKKNWSKASLRRNGSAREVTKATRHDRPKPTRSSTSLSKQKGPRQSAVHFDLGSDDHEQDENEGWTEVSNSESLTITRPASQASSRPSAANGRDSHPQSRARSPSSSPPHTPDDQESITSAKQANGSSSQANDTTGPDLHVITNRLLWRHPPHNAPPQMSTISATVTPLNHSPRSFSQSQTSTLNVTPGTRENVVSHFLGDEPDGTPSSNAGTNTIGGSISPARNAFGPNSPTARHSSANPPAGTALSAARTRQSSNTPVLSRTQQKLLLQRASSNLEHQHNAQALQQPNTLGGYGAATDARDPRFQRQLDRAAVEYRVVRRHRHPLADAVARVAVLPGAAERARRIAKGAAAVQQQDAATEAARLGLSQSLHSPRGARGGDARRGSHEIRARGQRSQDDSGLGGARATSGEAEDGSVDQTLRRLWERQETGGGD